MTIPVRLKLSRTKGFNLQAHSLAVNGLSAVNVARPGKWGNWFRIGETACGCRTPGECGHSAFRVDSAKAAVGAFRSVVEDRLNLFPQKTRAWLEPLRGKNLACWCPLGEGVHCHADVLLELANTTHKDGEAAG